MLFRSGAGARGARRSDGWWHVRISVNFDLCESNALCMGAAPEVFEVRDDGYLYVLQEEPGEDLRSQVEEAARLCPNQAITVEG